MRDTENVRTRVEVGARLSPATVPANRSEPTVSCQLDFSAVDGASIEGVSAGICLLVDCSMSMIGRRIRAAVDASKALVDVLQWRHRISLVSFQSNTNVLLNNVRAGLSNRGNILSQIERMPSLIGGSTDLAAGIREGIRVCQQARTDTKVMVILSDGAANSAENAQAAGLEAAAAGIQLFAVGLGVEYEAGELLRVVGPSNGAVFGEQQLGDLKSIFCGLIERIDKFVAVNAHVDLYLKDGVAVDDAICKISPERAMAGPLDPLQSGGQRLRVGNLERNRTHSFLLQLTLPQRATGVLEPFRAVLSYDTPGCQQRQVREFRVSVNYEQEDATPAPTAEASSISSDQAIAREIDAVLEARSRGDSKAVLTHLRRLQDACTSPLRDDVRRLVSQLEMRGVADRALFNRVIVQSQSAPVTDDPAPVIDETESDPEEPDEREQPEPEPEPEPEPQPEAPPREPRFEVVLLHRGETPIQLLREIRDATGLQLHQINAMFDETNAVIQTDLPENLAQAICRRMEDAGAAAEVREVNHGP